MNARITNRIETALEQGAAALFAVAVGYAAYNALGGAPHRLLYAAGSVALGYVVCAFAMRAASRPSNRFVIRIFDVGELKEFEAAELLLDEPLQDELVLTASDRLNPELVLTDADRAVPSEKGEDPLLLDDVLAAVESDSRVVRLFDRKAMPTPGQLSSSINRHLERHSPAPDASKALSAALAELRRSLR